MTPELPPRFYHLNEAGEVVGLITTRQLQDLWRRGTLRNDSPVLREGDEEWLPLATWGDILRPASRQPTRVASRQAPDPDPAEVTAKRMIRAGGALILVGVALALLSVAAGVGAWAYTGLIETAGIILVVTGIAWKSR